MKLDASRLRGRGVPKWGQEARLKLDADRLGRRGVPKSDRTMHSGDVVGGAWSIYTGPTALCQPGQIPLPPIFLFRPTACGRILFIGWPTAFGREWAEACLRKVPLRKNTARNAPALLNCDVHAGIHRRGPWAPRSARNSSRGHFFLGGPADGPKSLPRDAVLCFLRILSKTTEAVESTPRAAPLRVLRFRWKISV